MFFIAEIGNNHNGSMKRAMELIDLCVAAGADCVKFQMKTLRRCTVGHFKQTH